MKRLVKNLTLILLILLTLTNQKLIAQELSINRDLYSTYKSQPDLQESKDYTYLKVDYIPTGAPSTMHEVVDIQMTNTRPSNYVAVSIGYIKSGTATRDTVYVLYNGSTDSLVFASAGRSQMISDALANFGLGTKNERSAAFYKVKNVFVPVLVEAALKVDTAFNWAFLVILGIFVALAIGIILSARVWYKLIKKVLPWFRNSI